MKEREYYGDGRRGTTQLYKTMGRKENISRKWMKENITKMSENQNGDKITLILCEMINKFTNTSALN